MWFGTFPRPRSSWGWSKHVWEKDFPSSNDDFLFHLGVRTHCDAWYSSHVTSLSMLLTKLNVNCWNMKNAVSTACAWILRLNIWGSWKSVDNSYRIIDLWLAWSFLALSEGLHPHADPFGNKFSTTYLPNRFALAGSPIAGKWCCFVSGHRGDWQYLVPLFTKHRTHAVTCLLSCIKAAWVDRIGTATQPC